MPDIFDQYAHLRPDISPTVYVYEDTNPIYKGYLKVGYTARPVIDRVSEQYPTLRPATGAPFTILWDEPALYNETNHIEYCKDGLVKLAVIFISERNRRKNDRKTMDSVYCASRSILYE